VAKRVKKEGDVYDDKIFTRMGRVKPKEDNRFCACHCWNIVFCYFLPFAPQFVMKNQRGYF
jgi:hypothetical protein